MRKLRPTTKRPKSPWDMQRIETEKGILTAYGLRRKKEIRTAEALLRNFRQRARQLIAVADDQERQKLLVKLQKMGILQAEAGLDQVLALTVQDVLNRRLQTLVHKTGKALSIKHARQLIVQELVAINGRVVKYPSYMVRAAEETCIQVLKTFSRPVIVKDVETPEEAAQAE